MDIDFSKKIFAKMLRDEKINKHDHILIVGGLKVERDCFVDIGFKNVVISNICDINSNIVAPFKYVRQNMSQLTFPDNSFDFAFVSASLHHCRLPVHALLEMYRVARKGIIVIEARDSLLLRLGQKVNMSFHS